MNHAPHALHRVSLLAADSTQKTGSIWPTLIFMGLIGFAMYFLMIRPQRRRMREQQALQRAIGVDDEVITNSGIYGFVTAIDGDTVWLSIADDVEIRMTRSALLRKVNPSEEPAGGEPADDESEKD